MVKRMWKRRGRTTQVAVIAVAVIVLIIGVRMIGTVLATSGGSPYSVPLVLDTNPAGNIVETTIVAMDATVDIGNGVMAHAQTFNGQLPGPEFRLNVGDTVIVHFENQLARPTGIHWHGIELANASDGTPLTQNQVEPGDTFLYKFKVTRPGVYWYHPHHHSSTNQVFKGLYGSIIVTDPNEAALVAAGKIPGAADTYTLALSDITVCKTAGSNDADLFDLSLPWAGGAVLPSKPGPDPTSLCEAPTALDEDGNLTASYAAGDVPAFQPNDPTGSPVNEGQTVLTNGKNVGGRAGDPAAPGALADGAETLDVLAGQGLRLQIGNTATTRFFRLRMTDSTGTQIPLVRIGGQGGLLDNARLEGGVDGGGFDFIYASGEVLLDPGDRTDVVVAIPASATGVLTLWTLDFPRTGLDWSKIPTVPVMHLNVTGVAGSTFTIADGDPLRAFTGDPQVALVGPFGALIDPTTFVPPKAGCDPGDPCPMSEIQLTNNNSGHLGINAVIGEHDFSGDYTAIDHPESTRYAKLGDTLELTVKNTTSAHHPFHLHGFSIQPIDLTKPANPTYTFPYHEFRDNIDVPKGYTLRFRVKLEDRPLMDGTTLGGGLGRWVFHCHIFFHATFGMISEFDVVDPSGNERPYVNADEASVEVDEGQQANMTGTYVDPDGDAVTLTGPAIGTFTDNGDGTWSWSYTTTDGPDETQLLYVTAEDAGGHKDQVAFGLVVNNVAPTVTITSPLTGALYAVPANVMVTASVTDPGTADVLNCTFNWDGGGADTAAPVVAGACSSSKIISQAGVYTITVTADDGDGGTGSDTVMVVVYDPSAGFVTGGGTIQSPAGAYTADPSLTGKASFGFVSKYLKGASKPTGQTEFQFQAGNFTFHSSSYEWLVVAGAKAQYKGVGTVNGSGNFGFLLTATDVQVSGGGGVDKFRIKVWDKSAGDTIVYDNALGSSEDIDVANPQEITSGSIVIHKGK